MVATADWLLKDRVGTTLNGVSTALQERRRPLAKADAVPKKTDATLLGRHAPVQREPSTSAGRSFGAIRLDDMKLRSYEQPTG